MICARDGGSTSIHWTGRSIHTTNWQIGLFKRIQIRIFGEYASDN